LTFCLTLCFETIIPMAKRTLALQRKNKYRTSFLYKSLREALNL
jgi:hypothetical protein